MDHRNLSIDNKKRKSSVSAEYGEDVLRTLNFTKVIHGYYISTVLR